SKSLCQNLLRMKIQVISRHKEITDSPVSPPDAVSKSLFSMAVGIHDHFHPVLFRNPGKWRDLLQNIGRRIMQKHHKLPVSGLFRLVERLPKPLHFSCNELFRLLFAFLIPSKDSPLKIQIEWSFKRISLRPYQRIVLIGGKIILQKEEPSIIFLIQPS